MKIQPQSLVTAILASAITFIGLGAWQAMADNSTPSPQPRTLGYQGTLEWDGQPHDGPTLMKFSLYPDDADGTASCWEGEGLVDVRNGQFAVELGGNIGAPIADSDFDGGLFVGIEVQRLGLACDTDEDCGGEVGSCDMTLGYCVGPDPDFIALGNRQKLTAVPYAMASTRANDFTVNGDANVGGLLTANGPDSDGALGTGAINIYEDSASNARMVIDGDEIDSTSTLYLNLNSEAPVRAGGSLSVDDTLRVGTSGAPPAGSARLTLSPYSAGSAGDPIDDLNDFQLLLYGITSAPHRSYGLGIQSNTLFLNSDDDFRFYTDGNLTMWLDNAHLKVPNGPLSVGDQLNVGTSLTIMDHNGTGDGGRYTSRNYHYFYTPGGLSFAIFNNQSARVYSDLGVGGNLDVAGKIDIGTYTRRCGSVDGDADTLECSCNGSDKLLGGGARCVDNSGTGNHLLQSYPKDDTTWRASCETGATNSPGAEFIQILCARVD